VTAVTAVVRITAAGPLSWFRDLIRAEAIKFRSTRSTYFSLLGLAVVCIGLGGLLAESHTRHWLDTPPGQRELFEPVRVCFRGFLIGQLIAAALGVLVISSEYATGLIRTTFAAVPQRRSVLLAKAVVAGSTGLVVGTVTAFLTCALCQDLLQPTGLSVSVFSEVPLRSVGAAGLYIAVVCLLGVAFGALLRHTAGAVCALFALLFLLPDIVGSLPSPWNDRIGEWLPELLAQQLIGQGWDTKMFSPPVSLAVLLAYPVLLLAAACWRLSRSDA
jgi:ABC-type amino acid transport system permease subunit